MTVAIASGKGGVGKTLVSVNLALCAPGAVTVLDCDVEEPNDRLFLGGQIVSERLVSQSVPEVDEESCSGCRLCAEVCEFNAIAMIAGKPLVFEDLCHACGSCTAFCPRNAITERDHPVGSITVWRSGEITLVEGTLDVGKALAVPVIRAVKQYAAPGGSGSPVIVDSPPGTSCPMVWAVSGCDAAVLVAEPTAFGLHDLHLAVETLRETGVPFGVVVNKDGIGDDRVERYCAGQSIPLLGRIPHDQRIAGLYARGIPVVDNLAGYRSVFTDLWNRMEALAAGRIDDGI